MLNQKCKVCGKPSEFEYCFKCRRKALGLEANEETPCAICGKPTKGVRCKECRSKYSYKNNRKHCVDCGKELCLSYDKNMKRCADCARKYVAKIKREKAAQRMASYPAFLACEACGKQFPFKLVRCTNKPAKVCSYACGSKLRHIKAGNTRDTMIAKITAYIKDKKRYVTESEIKASLKVNRQQLRRYGISTSDLNKQLGFAERRKAHVTVLPKGRRGVEKRRQQRTREVEHSGAGDALRDNIVAWIREQGTQVTIRQILNHFHIDFYSTWNRYGFTIQDLHERAGVKYNRTVSWYELHVLKILRDVFGEHDVVAQKRFNDLYGDKGWPLRYDMYVKSRNCLIEVDGEQHYTDSGPYSKSAVYDAHKVNYAAEHCIPLLRIRIAPTNTFEERTLDLVNQIKQLDVVKESELLESQTQGNLFD